VYQRTVIVTGASRGIGRAIALQVAQMGHDLLLVSRDGSSLEKVAGECAQIGVSAQSISVDLTQPESGSLVAKVAGSMKKPLWALVNNAGMAQSATLEKTGDELLKAHMELNFYAPMRLMRACVPLLREGRIINICSTAALTGYPYVSAYAASKHALLGATRSLAREFAAKDLTFNAICPGYVRTEMFEQTLANIGSKTGLDKPAAEQKLAKLSPQGRVFEPAEVANVVRFLLGDEARGITGQALSIDGGEVQH